MPSIAVCPSVFFLIFSVTAALCEDPGRLGHELLPLVGKPTAAWQEQEADARVVVWGSLAGAGGLPMCPRQGRATYRPESTTLSSR